MRDGGRKREGANILLHPSVLAFLDDKNTVCQSQSTLQMCMCVCVCECVGTREKDAQSVQGAGVQNRPLITCVSTHTLTQTDTLAVSHCAVCEV